MKHFQLFLPLLLLFSLSAAARAQFLPVDMDRIEDSTSSYIHIGEGKLLSMRSCRMHWLECEFTVAEFDSVRNILSIEGRIVQSNASYDPAPGPVTLLIGPMPARDLNSLGHSFQVRERRALGDGGTFREKIVVHPGDVLCFVPTEPPADSLGNRPITTARADIYYIGTLLRSHQGERP